MCPEWRSFCFCLLFCVFVVVVVVVVLKPIIEEEMNWKVKIFITGDYGKRHCRQMRLMPTFHDALGEWRINPKLFI